MDRLCLIDPAMRGGSVNRLSSSANPKDGLFFVLTYGDNPNLGAFSRLLPLCFCFAAAVLFVRLLLSRKNRFVANTKHMAGSGWAQPLSSAGLLSSSSLFVQLLPCSPRCETQQPRDLGASRNAEGSSS